MNLSNYPKSKSLDIVDNNFKLRHMSVKQRTLKNGKTVFDVRVQYGKLRVCKTVRTTITDAKRLESKILQDLLNGRFDIILGTENPAFRQFAKEYEETVGWQKSYDRTQQLIRYLTSYFGDKRLTQITTKDFLEYRAMRLRTLSNATINREHACLRRMLNVAIQSDNYTISKNPLRGVRVLDERPAEDRTLTVDEYHKLLDAAPEYFRRIIFFAGNTAMRKMEILNLKFRQIKLWMNGGEIELIDTKSGKRETVLLNNDVVDLLKLIATEKDVDLFRVKERQKDLHVFTGMRGAPLKSITKPMMRTFREAKIEPRPFHTFRHFWTTEMFNAGVDVAKIKKIGRWRNLKTMLRYCHSNRSDEQEAVNTFSTHIKRKPAEILTMKTNQ